MRTSSPSNSARITVCFAAIVTCLLLASPAAAQTDTFFVTGRSVNTLGPIPPGPNPMLAGNPYNKQRNEASCDVSPYNQLVVLCAYNSYAGIPVFGDSFIGLSMTTNGGRTWHDRLLDNFPTTTGTGIGAADPIVRTAPGLAVIGYITLNSVTSRGTLTVAQMLEKNKENGEPYQFLAQYTIDIGTPGQFNDKDDLDLELDPAGGFVTVGGHQIPKGRLYFSYALFTGQGPSGNGADIYVTYSDDYGQNWSNSKKISQSIGGNQGVDLAADFGSGTVITTWRQVADTGQADAIMFNISKDNGRTWGKPKSLWTAPAAGRFFDQLTSVVQFRTLSMPSILFDGSAFHAYFSARGFSASSPDDARVVVSNSTTGNAWSAPAVVSPYAGRGHQIMPQAAVAGGRIQVDWIDTRNNDPSSFGRFIQDYGVMSDDSHVPLDVPPDPNNLPVSVYRNSADIYGVQGVVGTSPAYSAPAQAISHYRFGLDELGQLRQLEFNFINARMFGTGTRPFHGDYHALASQRFRLGSTGTWIRNTVPSTSNALFYAAYTDNRDVRGYLWAGLPSTNYTPPGATQGADAFPGDENTATCTTEGNSADSTAVTFGPNNAPLSRFQNIYVSPIYPGLAVMSPSGSKPSSATLERAYVLFVQNLTDQNRSYEFSIGNQPPGTGGLASFIASDAPADSPFRASCMANVSPACSRIAVTIQRGSSATRTVYVTSPNVPRPLITVNVTETATNGQTGSVILNGMPADMEIVNPDTEDGVTLPDLTTAEAYQPSILGHTVVYYGAGIVNPDLTPPRLNLNSVEYPRDGYPRDGYPRDGYPRDGYPRDGYPRDGYHSVAYPRDGYPRDGYPRDGYSRLQNSAIAFSALSEGDLTPTTSAADITWPVLTGTSSTNGANTVTGISSQVFINGAIPPPCSATVTTNCLRGAQLIVWVPHFYTTTIDCSGALATVFDNQVILNNIINPGDLASFLAGGNGPNTVNPGLTQPTFFVGPKQVVFMTLRLIGEFTEQLAQGLSDHTGAIVRSQPDTSGLDSSNDSADGTIDGTPPTINLGDVSVYSHVEGNATGGANVNVTVNATDDSGSASVSCLRTSGNTTAPLPADGTSSFVPLGNWTVTCTATDPSGNTSSAGFPMGVVDTTSPVIDQASLTALQGSVSLTPNTNGAAVTYNSSLVTATDIVDSSVTIVCTPPSGTSLPAGSASIVCTATDDSGNAATATYTFTIGPATTTTSVTVSNATFDGLPHGATAVVTGGGGLNQSLTVTYTGVSPTAYGPSTLAPTAAGSYTASATFDGTAGYSTSTDTKGYTIGKAATSVGVTCTAGPFSYTGSAQTPCSATVTGPGGLNQSLAVTYSNNINAGTATASASYAETANYSASTGSTTFAIGMAGTTTTVTCPAGPFAFTGSAQTPCSASVTGAGGLNDPVTVSYTNNVNAGTATAAATYTGTSNYAPSTDSKTFVIGTAGTSVAVSCSAGPFTYTGSAITPCTASVTGPGGLSQGLTVTYANNVSAGTATASASYAGSANYASSAGSNTFVIGKANTGTTVTCTAGPFVYTGAAQTPCSASVTGPGGLNQAVAVTYSNNVNAGTATANATYAGTTNYNTSSGSANFTINKATSAFSNLSAPSIVYGASPTVLGGTILSGSLAPSGSVSITLNGVTQAAAINANGTFSSSFATGSLLITGSPYTITYSYAGDTNFTTASDASKRLTVNSPYGFVAVSFPKTGNQGASVPTSWKYTVNGVVVDTASLLPVFRVTPLTSCNPSGTETGVFTENQDFPGNSNFQYFTSTSTWQFNWKTDAFAKGCYDVYIRTLTGSGVFLQDNGPFKIQLK